MFHSADKANMKNTSDRWALDTGHRGQKNNNIQIYTQYAKHEKNSVFILSRFFSFNMIMWKQRNSK